MSLEEDSLRDWHAVADRVRSRLETRLFVAGRFVDAVAGERLPSSNPATGEIHAEVSLGAEVDIDAAVAAARHAFRSGCWSRMAPRDRMVVLSKLADLIEANSAELAVLDTIDMGKPISDMVRLDIPQTAETFRFMAECIDKVAGTVTNTETNVLHFVSREPLGVVGAIVPWNYPLLMAAWKVAPALAAGNTVVLKPAEDSPLSALRLAELFCEAGGPEGVLNVVNGLGEVAGRALALHPDVAKISFTGSTDVGRLMLQYSGQSNMKRVDLECGGKTPHVFTGDGDALEPAVEAAVHGIFSNMGEVCNAGSRLLVDRRIHDEFVQLFAATTESNYQPGDPLDPFTTMGPLVNSAAQGRVLEYVHRGEQAGARLEFGGTVPQGYAQGAYVLPTLFTEVSNEMVIARDEIFGPVASVIAFEGFDEAIDIANDSIYGLAAGIWTRDIDTALRFVREVEAGVVWVNCFDEGDMTQPFGGYKQSGNARDKCLDSMLSYTQTKSSWIRMGDSHRSTAAG